MRRLLAHQHTIKHSNQWICYPSTNCGRKCERMTFGPRLALGISLGALLIAAFEGWALRTAMTQRDIALKAAEQARRLSLVERDAAAAAGAKLAAIQQENRTLRLREIDSADSMHMTAEAWLARVARLREFLAKSPRFSIPELQFLTDEQWLDATEKPMLTDEDYRRAAGYLRERAMSAFLEKTSVAMVKFKEANSGAYPTDLSQLMPYLDSPIDPTIFQRYTIGMDTEPVSVPGSPRLANPSGYCVQAPMRSWRYGIRY